jgi:glycosyltransferase involved in cell wall biosynthesis
MTLAPVILFVYNRPWHTQQTVEALQKNDLSSESDLYIFADGPKVNATDEQKEKIKQVREYIHKISGFKSVTICEKETNCGLANSVIAGVTEIINKFGEAIVVEDDLVTSKYFLRFMNEALVKYKDNEKVSAISAFVNPIPQKLSKPFFLHYFACWGWGTWKRGWDIFCPDATTLIERFDSKKMIRQFNIDNSVNFMQMLYDQAQGKIDSWAIRFYASSFLLHKLILYPNKSLVLQRGVGVGTHPNQKNILLKRDKKFIEMTLDNVPINLVDIDTRQDYKIYKAYRKFYNLDNNNYLIAKFVEWKNIGKRIIKKTLSLFKKAEDKEKYVVATKNATKWIFVSYIPYVFYEKDISKRLAHQNQNEMIAIVDVLKRLGYNIYVMAYDSADELPDIDVSIVFGLEPVFGRACEKYSNARKIYYATGAYYKHQNNMITSMTDNFNSIFNANIPYRRLVYPHNSCEISDSILQIGSNYIVDTYPFHLHYKIYTIHQSSQATALTTIEYAKENEYIFMGSEGNVLKGVGILIDYFCHNTDLTLNIVGPFEDDVMKFVRSKITPNIRIHGYLNIESEKLQSIIKKCNFIIYPSGSEGGCPGAVLNMMKKGMIPIVSRWAAFDEIEEYGYLLKELDLKSILMAIEWSSKLTEEKITEMKKKASKFVCNTYSLERFSAEFEEFIKKQEQMSPIKHNILDNKEE